MKYLILLFLSLPALAATKSLESELKELDMQDPVPTSRLSERYYAVQPRAVPLTKKTEVMLGAGQNYSGSGFLDSSQISLEGMYHFDDRWSVGGGYSRVHNEFTSSASNLQAQTGYLPDVDFVRQRLEARAQANLLYGKFRLTRRQAMSFDQYVGMGPVYNDLRSGTSVGLVMNLGFAFYIAKRFSFHVGAKDYFYREKRELSKGYEHNVHGYLQAGVLF